MSDLTAENVETVFLDCLFKEGEPTESKVEPEFIVHRYGFHPERLESHREEVVSWIAQLPHEFLKDGGGWTFLNLCMRADGVQWTGLQLVAEQLFELANGLGLASIQLPRELWSALPGGVPYLVFTTSAEVKPADDLTST